MIYWSADVDQFTDQLGDQLRSALSLRDVECSAITRIHKPYGSGFIARHGRSEYLVTVCAEPSREPGANITVMANPRRKRLAKWASFEPHFRSAVEAQFPNLECHWMTIDEYVDSDALD